ncbi:MAG: GNAT family N-acetyltransferase [Bdellovibrionales bacterium]
MPVIDNTERSQFELDIDGNLAFAKYRRSGNTLSIAHVEAPPVLRGTGAAGQLMQGLVDIADANGLQIEPICPYAVAWLRKHGR